MSDETTHESLTEALPYHLGEYLVAQVPDLKDFLDEWPQANEDIDMPCVSITTGPQVFRPLSPYMIKPQAGDITASKASVRYVTGIYDIPVQVDVWGRNKEERDDIFDAVFNALNPTISPMGLVLALPDYHNQLCDIVATGHEHMDTAERSDRDEWRTMIRLNATCKAIRVREEFVIESTEITVETYNTVEPIE